MTTHSSILAWKISWTEGPSKLQSMGSPRVGHNRSDSVHAQPVGLSLPLELRGTRVATAVPLRCPCLPLAELGAARLLYGLSGPASALPPWSGLAVEKGTL